jgi:plasmid replication initiation protein
VEREERIESESVLMKTSDGRDELNLAEFPLCALAHRLRPDQKTLQFEDRVWDEQRGEMRTRQLTITGADAYGLPTALDDEVLLGLIQLSKQQNFAERRVAFTRYHLLQLLGWRNESKSYERLEASLHRWTGVTLSYRNAWWNKARGCWVDETFHVLDNVRLCHRGDRQSDTAEPGVPR